MPIPTKSGGEFLVNSTTASSQSAPTTTSLVNGRFVVAWTDLSETGGDTSDYAVRAQVFGAGGSKLGAEILVNTTTSNIQYQPSITALSDGRFVVAWSDFSASGADTSGYAVRAQLFNANGSPSGAEILVNTSTTNNQSGPSVTELAGGRFVVAWSDGSLSGADATGEAVRARVFNANGSPGGAEFLVNTIVTDAQFEPSITTLADGRFVVTWQDFSRSSVDVSFLAVRAQMYNADGSRSGTEFLVNTTTSGDQFESNTVGLSDGRFVVTWTDGSLSGADVSSYAVRGQVFNTNGSKSGAEFLVNTTTGQSQRDPSIAALPDGRFVVAWTDSSVTGSDTSARAVRAQVFNTDGSKSDAEFLVNNITTGDQVNSSISVLADGRFVVAWSDLSLSGDDPSSTAVRSQIFDPRLAGVSLFGSSGDDDWVGTGFVDLMQGNDGNDNMSAGAGNDTLFGGAGADILVGQGGIDQSHGGDGNDYLYMGDGNDTAYGNVGVDVLLLEAGDDLGYGGDDTDYIFGGLGNDTLLGEGGVDVLQGEAGNDIFDGGTGGDYVYGGTGNDTAYGRDGNDIFVMEAGNDTAFGEEGQDYFYMGDGDDSGNGGAGVDVFLGGAGNDVFEGGSGVDYAWGEAGNDAFLVRAGSGVMVVNDFIAGGTDDVVRLTADTGITTFSQALAASTYYAGMNTTILTVDADTSVWLVGINRTQLTSADFVFV